MCKNGVIVYSVFGVEGEVLCLIGSDENSGY